MQTVFVVTESEVMLAKDIHLDSEFLLLSILKQKGAPIEGEFALKIKDGYWVSHHREAFTGNYVYHFKKVEHE